MKIRIRTLNGLYREVRLGLVYVLNGVDRIHLVYTSFSILSSSCVNSLRIPMRIKKKIGFVKVCYNHPVIRRREKKLEKRIMKSQYIQEQHFHTI
jgi:hypothetical protein